MLIGIVEQPSSETSRAVVVIVGGPQYRVGSHRLFATICRALADSGTVAMRFDHRGIGDSEGNSTFEDLDPDIRAAIDALIRKSPGVSEIVLLGLCDGASAAMMYAPTDERVTGLILLNPWVRSERTLAQSYFRGYYLRRLFSAEFWTGLAGGKVGLRNAATSFAQNAARALFGNRSSSSKNVEPDDTSTIPGFQVRMMQGLKRFSGHTLVILSGDDITADEFRTYSASRRPYRKLMRRKQITTRSLPTADHTFSTDQWKDTVIQSIQTWIVSW